MRIMLGTQVLLFSEKNLKKIKSLIDNNSLKVEKNGNWIDIPDEDKYIVINKYYTGLKIQQGREAIKGNRPSFDLLSNVMRKRKKKKDKNRNKRKLNKKYKK